MTIRATWFGKTKDSCRSTSDALSQEQKGEMIMRTRESRHSGAEIPVSLTLFSFLALRSPTILVQHNNDPITPLSICTAWHSSRYHTRKSASASTRPSFPIFFMLLKGKLLGCVVIFAPVLLRPVDGGKCFSHGLLNWLEDEASRTGARQKVESWVESQRPMQCSYHKVCIANPCKKHCLARHHLSSSP